MSNYADDVNEPDFVDIEAAAARLGVSRRTLERLAKTYHISRFKRPGDRRHYFRRADIDRLRGFHEIPSSYDVDG